MKPLAIFSVITVLSCSVEAQTWKKHVVMEQGHCSTAVALEANGDRYLDVVAGFNGKVSLFMAPDWKKEVVLYRFPEGRGSCIHSSVIDGDGDLDLLNAGRGSNNVVWYENALK